MKVLVPENEGFEDLQAAIEGLGGRTVRPSDGSSRDANDPRYQDLRPSLKTAIGSPCAVDFFVDSPGTRRKALDWVNEQINQSDPDSMHSGLVRFSRVLRRHMKRLGDEL